MSAPPSNEKLRSDLGLRAGELVEVRSREEILSTLDGNGCLEAMPFMPEMFQFCGQRLRVYKSAHKTCDTINNTGGRRVPHAVHLENIRCDGQAHGGCQAECLIFWKEAWLKRAGSTEESIHRVSLVNPSDAPEGCPTGCTERDVVARACAKEAETDAPVYFCQATQLLDASTPLSPNEWRQYWEDYTSGNVSLKRMLGVASYAAYDALIARFRPGGWMARILFWLYNGVQLLRGRPRHPRRTGRIKAGGPTPSAILNLQPGEMVRVKSFVSILKTIDEGYMNRGMKWDAEMVPYCGGTYRVRNRIEQIINEKTGKMIRLRSGAVTLEGGVCQSIYSNCRYFCPRTIFSFWREIWLERVAEAPASAPTGVNQPSDR